MTPSCFDLLDRHVVAGHAEREALRDGARTWSYARLLEEVAAFGGVLRHCGVVAGDRVGVALPDSAEAVVAVLACGRLGATHDLGATEAKVVVTSSASGHLSAVTAEVVLVKQVPGAEVELVAEHHHDWDVVMRAGRTDPAAWLEGAVLTPYDARTAALVGPLLDGGTVVLGG